MLYLIILSHTQIGSSRSSKKGTILGKYILWGYSTSTSLGGSTEPSLDPPQALTYSLNYKQFTPHKLWASHTEINKLWINWHCLTTPPVTCLCLSPPNFYQRRLHYPSTWLQRRGLIRLSGSGKTTNVYLSAYLFVNVGEFIRRFRLAFCGMTRSAGKFVRKPQCWF